MFSLVARLGGRGNRLADLLRLHISVKISFFIIGKKYYFVDIWAVILKAYFGNFMLVT